MKGLQGFRCPCTYFYVFTRITVLCYKLRDKTAEKPDMPRFLIARKRLFPTIALSALMATAAVEAAGPTGLLNDTGQTRCLNTAGTALEACSEANSGDASPYPRQDGRFGRDPAAGNTGISGYGKPAGSGGSGGFAFTPLDVNGNPIALTGNPPVPAETPRCIWDRVTNLIWEVKTDDGGLQDKDWEYAWGANFGTNCLGGSNCNTNNYTTALNAASVCPVAGAGDWRLPNRRELMTIVDLGRSSAPTIDPDFFPNTIGSVYWSSDTYAADSSIACRVVFSDGHANWYYKVFSYHVRLVRSGP